MNMRYKFYFRRKFFWRSFVVIGHKYEASVDKMLLFFEDGGVQEIKNFKNCEVKLKQDWVLAQKKSLEAQTGQPLNMVV
jgi:hypothetical protein